MTRFGCTAPTAPCRAHLVVDPRAPAAGTYVTSRCARRSPPGQRPNRLQLADAGRSASASHACGTTTADRCVRAELEEPAVAVARVGGDVVISCMLMPRGFSTYTSLPARTAASAVQHVPVVRPGHLDDVDVGRATIRGNRCTRAHILAVATSDSLAGDRRRRGLVSVATGHYLHVGRASIRFMSPHAHPADADAADRDPVARRHRTGFAQR